MRLLPALWAAPTGRCASGGGAAGRGRPSGMRPDPAGRAFSPSAVRAQVTALACTLPRDSGKPLSRWSATELARAVIQRRIVRSISGSTIKRWLNADRIKPWQYHSWQRPTDPRFLERAIPILTLYERAQALARTGHIVVCADEKTSIQARRACGRTTPARPAGRCTCRIATSARERFSCSAPSSCTPARPWRAALTASGSSSSRSSSGCSLGASGVGEFAAST